MKKFISHYNFLKLLFVIWLIAVILFFSGLFGPKKEIKVEKSTQNEIVNVSPTGYDFQLIIPKLSINAPIILDVDGGNKEEYLNSLQNGIAHFKGTSKPGGGSNVFIFGHSSYYAWDSGNYKTIFISLNDLNEGDDISVWYEKKEYKYKVVEKKTVDPDEISVLNPTKTEQLTLMTCWPPGTTAKRLIVVAKPVQ